MTAPKYSDDKFIEIFKKSKTVGEVAYIVSTNERAVRRRRRRLEEKYDITIELKSDYEAWRNRGTTQLPIAQGLVLEAKSDFDLYLTSDWHCGQECCDYAGLGDMVKSIDSNPKARVLIGGDVMEVTPPGHHDGGRNSDSYIDGQIIRTSNALAGIAKKIDLVIGGNHGKARLAKVGIDPDLLLSHNIKCDYSTVPRVVLYKTPVGTIKVCIGHGRSGGQNSMTELKKMRQVYPNCDIYCLGHDHSLFAEPDGSIEYTEEGEEYWSPVWLCRSGSFLTYAEYARYGFYAPKPTGYLIARIREGKVKAIDVVKA